MELGLYALALVAGSTFTLHVLVAAFAHWYGGTGERS